MLPLILGLIVVLAVFWVARALITAFGVGEPIATVIYVVLVLLVLWWLLGLFGVVGSPSLRLSR